MCKTFILRPIKKGNIIIFSSGLGSCQGHKASCPYTYSHSHLRWLMYLTTRSQALSFESAESSHVCTLWPFARHDELWPASLFLTGFLFMCLRTDKRDGPSGRAGSSTHKIQWMVRDREKRKRRDRKTDKRRPSLCLSLEYLLHPHPPTLYFMSQTNICYLLTYLQK